MAPYSEVSEYEYITGDELEAYHIHDYSAVDATYTEAVVMAQVSQAEKWVNEYCGQSFTGTIPDGVDFATLEMARHNMEKIMIADGYLKELTRSLSDVITICKAPLARNKVEIDYSASRSDFDLRLLEG